jgi:hypothetical protein
MTELKLRNLAAVTSMIDKAAKGIKYQESTGIWHMNQVHSFEMHQLEMMLLLRNPFFDPDEYRYFEFSEERIQASMSGILPDGEPVADRAKPISREELLSAKLKKYNADTGRDYLADKAIEIWQGLQAQFKETGSINDGLPYKDPACFFDFCQQMNEEPEIYSNENYAFSFPKCLAYKKSLEPKKKRVRLNEPDVEIDINSGVVFGTEGIQHSLKILSRGSKLIRSF